jgi:hypothetical protein
MGSAVARALAHLRAPTEAQHQRHARDRLSRSQGRLHLTSAMPLSDQQRKSNLRLALILATVALVFAVGFVVKMVWLR